MQKDKKKRIRRKRTIYESIISIYWFLILLLIVAGVLVYLGFLGSGIFSAEKCFIDKDFVCEAVEIDYNSRQIILFIKSELDEQITDINVSLSDNGCEPGNLTKFISSAAPRSDIDADNTTFSCDNMLRGKRFSSDIKIEYSTSTHRNTVFGSFDTRVE